MINCPLMLGIKIPEGKERLCQADLALCRCHELFCALSQGVPE